MSKVALITGINGQDGAYLAKHLIELNYQVHGILRRTSQPNTFNLDFLLGDEKKKIQFHYGDLTDASSLHKIVQNSKPDELYNLAAQSHVHVSFLKPEYTGNVDGLGVIRLLEAIRDNGLAEHTKFYQASTSELYGKVTETPQNESTPFHPRSPYGVAKLYSFWAVKNYREAYNMHASNGILFNHESPLRGENFVTQKIIKGVINIRNGALDYLALGNLDAQRDWGHAKDYVQGMHLMLQQEMPDDYVLASGQSYSVRTFVEKAFGYFGQEIIWENYGINEQGFDRKTGKLLVRVNPEFFRPSEVDQLLGCAQKAKVKLGWETTTTIDELIEDMIKGSR